MERIWSSSSKPVLRFGLKLLVWFIFGIKEEAVCGLGGIASGCVNNKIIWCSFDLVSKPLVELCSICSYMHAHPSNILPPFQIISHSKNFGESNFFKLDQIYTTR